MVFVLSAWTSISRLSTRSPGYIVCCTTQAAAQHSQWNRKQFLTTAPALSRSSSEQCIIMLDLTLLLKNPYCLAL